MKPTQSSTENINRVRQRLPRETIDAASSSASQLARLRQKVDRLSWKREQIQQELKSIAESLTQTRQYLEMANEVTEALDQLSQELFEQVLSVLREKLTIAIEEVLGQPVKFHAEATFRRGAANVDFSIQRDGFEEDVVKGQGGSVQNVLSVGLRLFALASLNGDEHRRFLVLDEQDCWLRSELVPKLVKIVYRAAKELGFQVIMISHHDLRLFEDYADKIYHFLPQGDGVKVAKVIQRAIEEDSDAG